MKKKKKVALVFGITSNYLFALANTLIGLTKHNKKFWDDIIVYYDQLNDESIERINKITVCKFINFSKKDYLEKLPKDVLQKYSEACFYRYECFELLKEYETVVWNDVDILIQGDITGLLDYGQNGGFAITQNTVGFNNEANFSKLIMEYDMYVPLYNSGILVLKDTIPNYEKMRDWCVSKTIEYSSILRWPDQGILNLLIQEFNINIDLIDINKYCCHPSQMEYTDTASIIHAYGDEKFWSSDALKQKFPEWVTNNEEWRKINVINNENQNEKAEKPLVSCIMSTYNRYDYLKESIDSILNQTYQNFELIIVLEKCENQEKIEKILKGYNDNRIIIIKNEEKLGFPKSLNIGIENAKGKYIARMDDDDISLPERFEKQVDFLENHPEYGICGTNAKFFGKYNTVIGVEMDPDILKIITLYRCPFIHPTVMMNKELINKYNLRYDEKYFTEDYELWSRAVGCFPVANIDEVLLHYRANGDGLTSGQNELKIHNSHKKIMRNQFQNYLHLNVTENELEVLQGRKNVFNICYNFDESVELKKGLCLKIIKANEKYKVYNSSKIKKILWDSQFNSNFKKQSIFKKIIKRVLKPIYNRLMNRVDSLITEHDIRIYNYINNEFKKIQNEKRTK